MIMKRIIMHIDVNNAFLSWSAVKLLYDGYKTDIRKIEAVIGGDEVSRHGIVLAKSPVAKKKGVKTAETLMSARRKCNNLKIYPPDFKWYQFMSRKMFDLIRSYTPDIEILSIDECFLDYTKVYNLYGDPIKFAYHLKNKIYKTLKFTVNIGIANNKLCAKMASDFKKPNRVHTLFDDEVPSKMFPLDVGDLYGVGKKTTQKLKELNINTIYDLAHSDVNYLYKYFKNQASILIDKANGIDYSEVNSEVVERKGISNSTTFSYNLTKLDDILNKLRVLTENVCISLRKKNKYAKVIGVTIKNKNFITKSHQKKLLNATNNTDEIYSVAKKLIIELWDEEPIRLMGISLNNLTDDSMYQISLFENISKKDNDDKLDKIIDDLKLQYGSNIINKASIKDILIVKKNE